MTLAMAQIKKGRKFDQVLEGALTIFTRDGFDGASVDDIAKEAGVSKATLYSYFPDKRILFAEVARLECEQQAQHTIDLVDFSGDIRDSLTHVSWAMINFVTSEFGINVFRICVAESVRFPELGERFYASGPSIACGRISEFLECAVNDGKLQIDNIELAAYQLMELTKAYIFPRILCGIQTEFSEDEKRLIVDSAVDMFIARYGVETS
ncbi:MAG: TetR/AcrR family transcriptional regulator [Pseudoruegeria sp.]